MSIWTKPLWGKASKASGDAVERPRASAVRMRHLAAATSLELVPWWIGVMLLAKGLLGLEILVLAGAVIVADSGVPSGQSSWAAINAFFKGLFGDGRWASLLIVIAFTVWIMPWLMRIVVRHRIARMTREGVRTARRRQRRGRSRKMSVLAISLIAAMLVVMGVVSLVTRAWPVFVLFAALITNFAGMNMIIWGWRSRVGKRIVCAKCDYAMGSWRGAATMCPECHNAWKEPWRARIGERRVRGRVIAMGALVLVVNAAGVAVLMSLALRR